MWQGINNITGFKGNKQSTVNIAASLPDELNTFYARFKADNSAHRESAPAAAAEEGQSTLPFCRGCSPILQTGEHPKAVGPDGIPGRVLRACAFQLTWGFYRHFQFVPLSVHASLMLQKSTIVPIPKKKKSHA